MIGGIGERRAGKASFGEESDGLASGALIDDVTGFEQNEVIEKGKEFGLGLVDGADDGGASAGC